MKVVIAVLVALLASQVGLGAETLQFPLPNAVDDYPRSGSWPRGNYIAEDTVTFDGPDATVLSVRIVAAGDVVTGELECCDSYACPYTVFWWMSLDTIVKKIGDPGSSFENNWVGSAVFQNTGAFNSGDDLVNQQGFVSLSAGDQIWIRHLFAPELNFGCIEVTPAPTGTITTATLVLDVEYVTPVEPTTWGRIKSLFDQ